MKKFLIATAVAFAAATPAVAATTIEFKRDSGETRVVTLDGEGSATTADGAAFSYTYDEAGNKMCFQPAEGDEMCATFETKIEEPAVGASTRYTASDGAQGTATITAVTE